MIEKFYQDPKTIQKYKGTFLGSNINSYLEELLEKGYSEHIIRKRLQVLYDFSEYLSKNNLYNLLEINGFIKCYLEEKRGRIPLRENQQGDYLKEIKGHLTQFHKYLICTGVISEINEADSSLERYQALLDDFAEFLKNHKGLSDSTRYYYHLYAKRFLRFTEGQAMEQGESIELALKDVYQFILQYGQEYERTTVSCICSALRSFFRFLFLQGKISQDYSSLLERPKIYQGERCIRYLNHEQISQIMRDINGDNPKEKRDYAILMLLKSYGLRGKEVVQLCLDDLDWRGETLLIRQTKCGECRKLPMIEPVGAALIRYLKIRPKRPYREIFLSTQAPFNPLDNITKICREAIIKAGIVITKPGSHTFRYSCAQGLFQKGYSIKWIADVLGHRDIRSTIGYLNIALYPLREVSLNDAEDLL